MSAVFRPHRVRLAASAAVGLVALVGCSSSGDGDDRVATADSVAPVTLGELDGVVITVAPEDFSGEVIVIGEPLEADDDSDPDTGAVTTASIAPELADAGVGPETVDPELNPLGGDDPEDDRMPDVVCMDLQAAQDEIQDHGVFFSKSEDATGQGRRQLWDRNWVVVAQSPAPGEEIGEGEAVLSVVKDGEPSPC